MRVLFSLRKLNKSRALESGTMYICSKMQKEMHKKHRNVESCIKRKGLLKKTKVCVCVCVQRSAHSSVCLFLCAQRAGWAVLKSALRIQESPWPAASNR